MNSEKAIVGDAWALSTMTVCVGMPQQMVIITPRILIGLRPFGISLKALEFLRDGWIFLILKDSRAHTQKRFFVNNTEELSHLHPPFSWPSNNSSNPLLSCNLLCRNGHISDVVTSPKAKTRSLFFFASQGGLIIIAQIKNECGNIMAPYGDAGKI